MVLGKNKFLSVNQEWLERYHAVTNKPQGMNYERTIFIIICKNDKKMILNIKLYGFTCLSFLLENQFWDYNHEESF